VPLLPDGFFYCQLRYDRDDLALVNKKECINSHFLFEEALRAEVEQEEPPAQEQANEKPDTVEVAAGGG
jgi:hypothetical protein